MNHATSISWKVIFGFFFVAHLQVQLYPGSPGRPIIQWSFRKDQYFAVGIYSQRLQGDDLFNGRCDFEGIAL